MAAKSNKNANTACNELHSLVFHKEASSSLVKTTALKAVLPFNLTMKCFLFLVFIIE